MVETVALVSLAGTRGNSWAVPLVGGAVADVMLAGKRSGIVEGKDMMLEGHVQPELERAHS